MCRRGAERRRPSACLWEVPVACGPHGTRLVDLLEPAESWPITSGRGGRLARVDPLWPHWLRILAVR
jgi:hypothetical protein